MLPICSPSRMARFKKWMAIIIATVGGPGIIGGRITSTQAFVITSSSGSLLSGQSSIRIRSYHATRIRHLLATGRSSDDSSAAKQEEGVLREMAERWVSIVISGGSCYPSLTSLYVSNDARYISGNEIYRSETGLKKAIEELDKVQEVANRLKEQVRGHIQHA